MTDEKIMKNAQYRKGLGIAWFNATNSAIEMVKLEGLKTNIFKTDKKGKKKVEKIKPMEVRIALWRNLFLEEHKDYYAKVIANVGQMYDSSKAIEVLKKATDLASLKLIWMTLSEDERHDGEIRKVVKEIKSKFEKKPNEKSQ